MHIFLNLYHIGARVFKFKLSTISTVIQELSERQLIKQILPPLDYSNILEKSDAQVYTGIDPTADSLHVGHLLILCNLFRWCMLGSKAIIVLGGSTAKVGDPTGQITSRVALNNNIITHNVNNLRKQIMFIVKNFDTLDHNKLRILNNEDWYNEMHLLEYVSEVSPHFQLGTMLRKDSVRSRLKNDHNPNSGMTLKEFLYQTFQAYDWYHLYKTYNCCIQIGGSDQMGNMEAGYEFIKKKTGNIVHCLTYPLLLTQKGEKISKSNKNNVIWLNPEYTSPFHFYQYFVRLMDKDLELNLKYFTFMPLSDIETIINEHQRYPEKRVGQIILANQLTKLIHGTAALTDCQSISNLLYDKNFDFNSLDSSIIGVLINTLGVDLEIIVNKPNNVPKTINNDCKSIVRPHVIYLNNFEYKHLTYQHLFKWLVESSVISNESEIIQLMDQNALRINDCMIKVKQQQLTDTLPLNLFIKEFQGGQKTENGESFTGITLLKIGRRNYHIIKWKIYDNLM